MTAQTILPANSATGAFEVSNSLRFNVASSDYLALTPGSAGNTKLWTWSAWFKKSPIGADIGLFGQFVDANNGFRIKFRDDDRLQIDNDASGSSTMNLILTQQLKDISAWYHLVVAYDSAQGTASNRVKIYINGSQVTAFNTETYPGQNVVTALPIDGSAIELGRTTQSSNNPQYFSGHFSEVVLVDGQALAPTIFGEFDDVTTTVWKPKKIIGAVNFGTNGFYLQFKGSGTSANASGLGADTSGNDDHFTVSNLTAVDQSIDTCTNNFPTLNHTKRRLTGTAPVYSEGNLKLTGQTADGANNNAIATFQNLTSGKWYFEVKCVTDGDNFGVGISDDPDQEDGNAASASNHVWYNIDGTINYGTDSSGSYGNTYTDADIISVAFDLDNGVIYFYKNGTIQNSGTAARTDLLTTMVEGYTPIGFTNKGVIEFNFGSPSFAISSSNADGNGFGNFEYAVPSGYYSINTKNLAEYG